MTIVIAYFKLLFWVSLFIDIPIVNDRDIFVLHTVVLQSLTLCSFVLTKRLFRALERESFLKALAHLVCFQYH